MRMRYLGGRFAARRRDDRGRAGPAGRRRRLRRSRTSGQQQGRAGRTQGVRGADHQAQEWSKEFFPKIGEIYKDKGIEFARRAASARTDSDEERAKRAEATAEVTKVAYKELGDILKKEQLDRLKQIERQQMGVNAFINAEVVESSS